jgi:hypothetical protein
MKSSMIIVGSLLWLGGLLGGCASAPAGPAGERDAVLHSTVGGLRQAEMRADAEPGFWASLGEAGYGVVQMPFNLIVDIVSLPADLWRTGKTDVEENRHQHEYDHESDSWYDMARGPRPKE